MKFRLEIDLESDSMVDSDYKEIAIALTQDMVKIIRSCQAKGFGSHYNDYYHDIIDIDGITIGQWSIKIK